MGVQKKVVSLLTASAMVLGSGAALPEEVIGSGEYINASAATIIDSGTCGTNVTWKLIEGTLIISGTGKMKDYYMSDIVPWDEYRLYIHGVIIHDGVTSIGRYAFNDCYYGITSITIPDSVTSIGEYAFYDCPNLKSVTIPDSVTSIGARALGYYYSDKSYKKIDGFKISCYKGTAAEQYVVDNGFEYELLDSANIVASGTCGENVSWTLDDEGTLTISGTGEMAFNSYYSIPWDSKRTYIKKVVIKNGITSIGTYSFSNCGILNSIIIPDSVKSIGQYAFYRSGLTNITIPSSVTSISTNAFEGCSGLTNITVSNQNSDYRSVDGILYNKELTVLKICPCGKTNVTIPNSVTGIGGNAFRGCSGLTSITIPDSVTIIGPNALYGCTGLTSVTIPNSITSIESGAFGSCSNLKSINIPNSITRIGFDVFSGCSGLTSVTIPDSVTSIGEHAFCGCSGLKSVTVPKSVTNIVDEALGYYYDSSDKSYKKYDTFKIYCYSGTAGEKYAKDNGFEYTLLDSANIVASGTCGENVSWTLDDSGTLTISGTGAMTEFKTSDSSPWYSNKSIKKVIIKKGVTSVGYYAFHGCSGITSVSLPDSLTSIGDSAFGACTGLTNIIIPDSVKSIGFGSFCSCSGLTSVSLPEGVTTIKQVAFGSCPNLESITIPKSVTTIKDQAFGYDYDSRAGGFVKRNNFKIYCWEGTEGEQYAADNGFDYELLDNITVVSSGTCGTNVSWTLDSAGTLTISGTGAMKDYNYSGGPWNSKSVKRVVIKDGVTSIGKCAFENCAMTSVTIPDSVTTIADEAFRKCSSLTDIKIPGSVKSIGRYVFAECDDLKSVTMSGGVAGVGENAFYNCKNLTSVSLPNTFTSFGEYAFFGCSALTSITIPNSVTSIGEGVFRASGLTNITIPDSVKSIGDYVFFYCDSLTSVNIPDSVEKIGKNSFNNCENLKSVSIQSGLNEIGENAFGNCPSLSTLTVSVKNQKYKAFGNVLYNKDMTELVLCPGKLTTLTIQSSVKSIGDYAFYHHTGLTSLTLSDGVEKIGNQAFEGCKNLTGVTLPGSLASIGEFAFNECTGLKSLDIPGSVTSIGKNAFQKCTSLTTLTVPGSVASIGDYAFTYCTGLTGVTLSEGIKSIGQRALFNFQKVKSITIPKSVTSIGEKAIGYYYDSSSLTQTNIDGFKIYCYSGTAGEQYAKDNGFEYELLDKQTDISECSSIIFIPVVFTYDGTAKKPRVTVTDGSVTLKEGTDYTVTCSDDCVNAGTKTVVVTGKGNYKGSHSEPYTIKPKSADSLTISASATSFTYNGTEQKPTITVKDGSTTLKSGTDYTVTYPSDSTNAGTKTVTIKGINNYTGSVNKTYTINPKAISGATITLSATSYTYDGTAKKPTYTVKYGSVTLKNGTDYTVTYPSDSTSAGSKTVTIKGINNYTGSVDKTYTINPKAISSATITLSATSYTYDGTAKKPTVTVKDGSKTLVSGTDYTVTYPKDCVSAGSKTVTIKGTGNYTGQVSGTYTISAQTFVWGRDNWSFDNTPYNFKWDYAVNDKVIEQVKKDFIWKDPEGKEKTFGDSDIMELKADIKKNSSFNGACFGMTLTEILASQRQLDLSRYGGNSVVNKNSPTEDITSVINFFQILQFNKNMLQVVRQTPFLSGINTQEEYITTLADEAASNKYLIKVGYLFTQKEFDSNTGKTETSEVRHAVLAYGAEDCNYYSPVTKLTYDKRILIADPNFLSGNELNEDACIYYRSSDKSWIVPCRNKTLPDGTKQSCCWNADTGTGGGEIMNLYRYKTLTEAENLMADNSMSPNAHYISGLTIENESGNTSIVEQVKETGNPNAEYSGEYSKTGIARYDAEFADEMYIPKNEEMYALWNSTASYTLSYKKPSDFSLKMDYQSIDYYMDVTDVSYTLFKPSGYIAVKGSDADYSVTMVTDDSEKVNDWYALTAEGSGADSLELKKTKGGYVIKSNSLNKLKITAESSGVTAETIISTKYTAAFIYEIDKNTIGIKVDTDGNGTYETDITSVVPVITAEPGENSVKLSWSSVPGATKYAVCGLVNGKWTNLAEGTGTSYTLKNLVGGKDYRVAVVAMIGGKWTNDLSNAVTVTPDTPKPVLPVITAESDESTVKLTWTAVPGATRYAVCGRINGKWEKLAEGTGTAYTFKDLVSGKDYIVAVIAMKDGKWESDLSNAVTVRLAQPKPVYPIVTTIDYNKEYHQFKINWSAVPNAEQYGIAVKIGNKWKIQAYVSGKTTSFISPKLTPGKTYEMVVCAKVNGEWDTSKILNRAVKVTVK